MVGELLLIDATHGWRSVQHEVWRSVHLLLVVGIVSAGVVIFALVVRHFSRRGRSGRLLLTPTGEPGATFAVHPL